MFRHFYSLRWNALLCFTLLTLALLASPLLSRTQQQPPIEPPPPSVKEVEELLAAVADIGEMRFINPLQLTNQQLDKLIAVITSAQIEYNNTAASLDHAAMKRIASDIRAARQQSLEGKTVPAERNDRINKTIDAHLKNAKTRQDAALKNLSQKVREILLSEQFSTAAKMAREEMEKINPNAKGTEEQWFNLYVKNVIMSYPRIVPLLKDVRAARDGGKTANTPPEQGGENPSPR